MSWQIVLLQVAAAAMAGAVIGLERELSAQHAGLRTHMLVCLGATLATVAGASLPGADPTRIAAQVITGIGFLGGGAILREGLTVHGLTTAASLWVTASIGLAFGLRAWWPAAAGTVLVLVVLVLLKKLEDELLPRRRPLEVTLTVASGVPLTTVERAVLAAWPSCKVSSVRYVSGSESLVLSVKSRRGATLAGIAEQLRTIEGVDGVAISA
ncbi:MgtC/SapB family protein [Longispora albida]|uniref:MgtC/SapB family protein n=1 Tax=Longispora albida TaxID=203523 RepID=UPI0003713513|nr:MgtC/SapB family protein [Longispora albida]